jgi:hypothetical protein
MILVFIQHDSFYLSQIVGVIVTIIVEITLEHCLNYIFFH